MQDVGASSPQRKLTVLSENSRKYLRERGSTHVHTAAVLCLVPGDFKVRYLYTEGELSLCWPPSQQMLDGLLSSCFSAGGRHRVCSGEGVPFFSHVLIISPLSILPHKDSTVSSQLGRSTSHKSSNTVSEPGVNPRYILHRPCKAGSTAG